MIKIKPPTTSDFSDPRLETCFSINFLKKLQKLEEEIINFHLNIKAILESLEDNLFTKKELKEAEEKVIKKIGLYNSVFYMNNKESGKKIFFKKFNQKKWCVLCGNKRVQDCHILQQSFFRKFKRKRKHYDDFKNHLSNIIFLCPNHHDALDKGNLQKNKIDKLIRNRKLLNNKFLKGIDKELKEIKRNNNQLKRFHQNTSAILRKELKKIILKL